MNAARRKARTRVKYMQGGWFYMQGGNPPTHAGIFDADGNRLAWWPAAIEPTQERLEIAYRVIIARETDNPVPRTVLLKAFKEE